MAVHGKIYENVAELIGNTPLVKLSKLAAGTGATVIAKLEGQNPALSVKDRIALSMINDAEKKGLITPGKTTIIEPTSGNTGIAIALVALIKGYKVILTMPETMSVERRTTLLALNAELVLTPGPKGMKGAIAKAAELAAATPDSFVPQQFENQANPEIHFKTTGPEIWNDTNGTVDILISGVGTGGTISGVSKFIKSKKPAFKAIAVEPTESSVLSGKPPGPHGIQGIGAGFKPNTYDANVVDEVVTVSTPEAIAAAKQLSQVEGIFAGISSGAAVAAALKVAARPESKGKVIVVIIPDNGTRYLSTKLFEDVSNAAKALPVSAIKE